MAKLLNQTSGQPQMLLAMTGWTSKITLIKITQEIIDGFNTDFFCTVEFKGVVQPLNPRQLMLKPEGERSFEWLWVHCPSGMLALKTGDKIEIDGKRYKLNADQDYSRNSYEEYHLIRDFENRAK